MKKTVLVLVGMAMAAAAQAQQQAQFTHYAFNGLYLNPAYAGIRGQTELSVLGRAQYLGISSSANDADGSLRTGLVSASVPIVPLSGGVGVLVYYDRAAVTDMVHTALSYAQHFPLGRGKLGIGVQGTLTYLNKGSYRALDLNDPRVPESGSDHKFDAGAGVWYEGPRLYVGLSANNLFRSVYTLQSARRDASGTITGYLNTSQALGENHAYFTAGYTIPASPSVAITPTVLLKAVLPGRYAETVKYDQPRNYSFEGGVRAMFNDQFWAGVNYRQQESVSGLLGYGFGPDNRYRLGAAFDLVAFNQDARAVASYEVLLQLRLPKTGLLTRPAVHTPRYNY